MLNLRQLGIFLCMRCAALHRKIGTHITKVKSLSMDSWSNEQVETMKRIGNMASNRIYSSPNAKIPFSLDSSDTDAAMERFIRQKYQNNPNMVKSSQKPDIEGTYSDDRPPPLPPKTGNRFGLRSVSSIFPLSSKYKKESVENSQENSRQRSLSPRKNKPSRVFGVTVEGNNDFDSKNTRLCEMGFTDQKMNLTILKGLDGNLEKSIEALVCLAEGNANGVKGEERAANLSSAPPEVFSGLLNQRLGEIKSSPCSMNPFNRLQSSGPVAQPQSSQSTGGLQSYTEETPYQQKSNPNIPGQIPVHSQHEIVQAFQEMSVNNLVPLFPNRTGPGNSILLPTQPQIYPQHLTPTTPSIPLQYCPSTNYANPYQQPQPNSSSNPFMQSLNQTTITNVNTPNSTNTTQQSKSQAIQWSADLQSPLNSHSLAAFELSTQQHSTPIRNPYLNQINSSQSGFPFPDSTNSQSQGLALTPENYQFRQQTQPNIQQQSVKADNRSILELYNYPQLAPNRPGSNKQQNLGNELPTEQQQQNISSPLLSPASNCKNPFASNPPSPAVDAQGIAQPGKTVSHGENQGIIGAEDGGWLNGRHSPDAWRSISARSVR
ncbi:hypothetical protein K3495_g7549 [Podosphaera aphanis]|nr:hypothetical protein K3495_g7549 [Podosphaera aphanis]